MAQPDKTVEKLLKQAINKAANAPTAKQDPAFDEEVKRGQESMKALVSKTRNGQKGEKK